MPTCFIFKIFLFNFQLAQYILKDEVQNPGHGTPTFDLLGSGKWAHNQTRILTVYYYLAFIFEARLREYSSDVKAAMLLLPNNKISLLWDIISLLLLKFSILF